MSRILHNDEGIIGDLEESSDYVDEHPRTPHSIAKPPFFPLALLSIFVSITLSVSILIFSGKLSPVPTPLYLSEHKDLLQDWER